MTDDVFMSNIHKQHAIYRGAEGAAWQCLSGTGCSRAPLVESTELSQDREGAAGKCFLLLFIHHVGAQTV